MNFSVKFDIKRRAVALVYMENRIFLFIAKNLMQYQQENGQNGLKKEVAYRVTFSNRNFGLVNKPKIVPDDGWR